MKLDKIEQKINDLTYRIKLDEIAINKAQYNLKFARRLGLSEELLDKYSENLDYYNSKIVTDKNTLNIFKECFDEYGRITSTYAEGYLFRCTLPFEEVDGTSNYQTSILVNDNVAKMFANGVSYKDVVSCLESHDIIDIETEFRSHVPYIDCKNVGVEIIDNVEPKDTLDEPILASVYGKNKEGLIASSKIFTCYPFENVSYKTLSGETYNPGVPSFDEINALRTATSTKEQKYEALEGLETTVREKMQASIDKINYALAETEAGYTLDDKFYTNGD